MDAVVAEQVEVLRSQMTSIVELPSNPGYGPHFAPHVEHVRRGIARPAGLVPFKLGTICQSRGAMPDGSRGVILCGLRGIRPYGRLGPRATRLPQPDTHPQECP